MNGPTIEQLSSDRYELLGQMTHATLADFVVEYFFRRMTWVVWLHHALSALTLAAAIGVAAQQERGFIRGLGDFGLAFVAMLVVLLPVHELIHAIAYRLAGAGDIRWDFSVRMMAVWVIAHRFVVDTRQFAFVALAPFVVINAALIVSILLFPEAAVFLLFVLLWHLHGCAGDWSLLNFVWINRDRGFWTFDDDNEGRSYFFGRALPDRSSGGEGVASHHEPTPS
ncbi:MAG TPA: DUF3267 domain-containing protein [Thermoanaerobaculia bacterium]